METETIDLIIIIFTLFFILVCLALIEVLFAIVKSQFTGYIFRKYDIQEIKNYKDTKIFIKKLFKFYAEKIITDNYRILTFSFFAGDFIEYEIRIITLYPIYEVFKNGKLEIHTGNIRHIINFILENKKYINEKIKNEKSKALHKSKFVNI